jgi:sugar phosphate isomerase/epimerase
MLLGLHTYSLYLHGVGQAWADFKLPWPRQLSTFELLDKAVRWGLDGLHLDDGVLENLETTYLKEVGAAAQERDLYLEYNFSMDLGRQGIGIQHDLAEAIATARALGADIVKVSMDLIRPRPVAASRFHPDVMAQIQSVAARLKQMVPAAEASGVKIAVENHCDTFSEEILWLLDRVDHPRVGACIDTVNAFIVM